MPRQMRLTEEDTAHLSGRDKSGGLRPSPRETVASLYDRMETVETAIMTCRTARERRAAFQERHKTRQLCEQIAGKNLRAAKRRATPPTHVWAMVEGMPGVEYQPLTRSGSQEKGLPMNEQEIELRCDNHYYRVRVAELEWLYSVSKMMLASTRRWQGVGAEPIQSIRVLMDEVEQLRKRHMELKEQKP